MRDIDIYDAASYEDELTSDNPYNLSENSDYDSHPDTEYSSEDDVTEAPDFIYMGVGEIMGPHNSPSHAFPSIAFLHPIHLAPNLSQENLESYFGKLSMDIETANDNNNNNNNQFDLGNDGIWQTPPVYTFHTNSSKLPNGDAKQEVALTRKAAQLLLRVRETDDFLTPPPNKQQKISHPTVTNDAESLEEDDLNNNWRPNGGK